MPRGLDHRGGARFPAFGVQRDCPAGGAVGRDLFERTRAGIVLTPAGHALQARAQMLEHLLRDAQAEVKAASEGLSGPLRIGGTPGAWSACCPLPWRGSRSACRALR
jgi:hypothetical protein